jgi:hypothetical protein
LEHGGGSSPEAGAKNDGQIDSEEKSGMGLETILPRWGTPFEAQGKAVLCPYRVIAWRGCRDSRVALLPRLLRGGGVAADQRRVQEIAYADGQGDDAEGGGYPSVGFALNLGD